MNMKKFLLSFMVLVVVMSACHKPKDIHFSVLGDSFTSYEGTVDPDTNYIWSYYPTIGVSSPDSMWFKKVESWTGWTLDMNNSFSGSHITNNHSFPDGEKYSKASYLRRMDNLGTPDVIFIFGGTNDIYHRLPVGEYVYSDWSEEQLYTLRPALAYMFDNMKQLYPKAKIYFMIDMELCIDDPNLDDALRQAYIESMHTVCNHYNVQYIDIDGIKKSHWHPDSEGQDHIAKDVFEAVKKDYKIVTD